MAGEQGKNGDDEGKSGGSGQSGALDFKDFLLESKEKRFNTKEILLHFINLLNPKKFKTLDAETQAKLIAMANALAQIGKDIQNPLPKIVEILRLHLGTPTKGSKGIEVLARLTTFENNYMPNITIQHEELKKARDLLRSQFDILVSQGENLDQSKMENLKSEIERLKKNKVEAFIVQKFDLNEKLDSFKAEVIGATGKTPSLDIPDEAPTPIEHATPSPQKK
jgi:hypothetical protein